MTPDNVKVRETQSQGWEKSAATDILRASSLDSLKLSKMDKRVNEIQEHVKKIQDANKSTSEIVDDLINFEMKSQAFNTDKKNIIKAAQDGDQAHKAFALLFANRSDYMESAKEYDNAYDKLYQKKPAVDPQSENSRQWKDLFDKLKCPDAEIQSHYYKLQDVLHDLSTSEKYFLSIAETPQKIEKPKTLLAESFDLSKRKDIDEVALQKVVQGTGENVVFINEAYEKCREKNQNIIDQIKSLKDDVQKSINALHKQTNMRSPYYLSDVTKPMNDDPAIKPIDIAERDSCAIYSTRSLLDLINVKTSEDQVAKDLHLGKYGQGTRPEDIVAGLNKNDHYPVHATLFEESLTPEKAQAEISKGNILIVNLKADSVSARHGIGIGGMTKDTGLDKTYYNVYDNLTRDRAACIYVPNYYINNNSYSYIVIENRQTNKATGTTSSAE